jgi:hypothetical protein
VTGQCTTLRKVEGEDVYYKYANFMLSHKAEMPSRGVTEPSVARQGHGTTLFARQRGHRHCCRRIRFAKA